MKVTELIGSNNRFAFSKNELSLRNISRIKVAQLETVRSLKNDKLDVMHINRRMQNS